MITELNLLPQLNQQVASQAMPCNNCPTCTALPAACWPLCPPMRGNRPQPALPPAPLHWEAGGVSVGAIVSLAQPCG